MKIKLVIVDLEIPRHVKKRLLRIGVPIAAVLVCGGVALAAGLHSWNDGDTLTSTDLNANFSALQDQVNTSLGGTPLAAPFSPTVGQVLAYDGSAWTPTSPAVANTQILVTTGKFNAPSNTIGTGVLEKYTSSSPYTVESVVVMAPAAGVITVSTDGLINNWEHTSGTADNVQCKLAPNPSNAIQVSGSLPVSWHVGQEVPTWGPIGDPFTMPFAGSYPFAVSAAGTYEFDLTCYATCKDVVTTGTYGCDIPFAHVYGVYLPATVTAN